MKNSLNIALDYSDSVISGQIPACIYVKQAAQRFKDDLASSDYYYDEESVSKVITFINFLDLTEQTKQKKFILEPWQVFIVASIYGIKNKKNNRRKYRSAYIELQRKNGKSQLVTQLAVYHLLTDTDAQVIVSANSREQAKNVDFKKIKQFASQLDPKQKHLIHYYNSIKFGTNELIVTASDSKKLDGLNASFCLIDELHEQPDNSLYNVLKSSQGGREEPLLMTITTAGFDTESFCYSLRSYCTDILSGQKKDENQFAIIYTIDSEDNYEDSSIWIKANPNLNISVYSEFLESEVNKAVNNTSERQGVLVKNFNQWLKSNNLDVWIEEKYIDQAMKDYDFSNQLFKNEECIVGVDLASVSDITQVSYLFYVGGVPTFINRYYIPEESSNSNVNRQLFKEAAQNDEIIITSGNVTDYDFILKDILKVNETNPIRAIYYDKFNSTQFIINATESGLNCKPFSQMPGSLNKPLKEFERLIKSGGLLIQRNSITKWMINNVTIDVNKMGNYSIDKKSKNKKIDGVQAMIDAFGGMLESPMYDYNIY